MPGYLRSLAVSAVEWGGPDRHWYMVLCVRIAVLVVARTAGYLFAGSILGMVSDLLSAL